MEVYHNGALPPEGEKAVGLRSETFVSLGLGSVKIATDYLIRCGIVAKILSLPAEARSLVLLRNLAQA